MNKFKEVNSFGNTSTVW